MRVIEAARRSKSLTQIQLAQLVRIDQWFVSLDVHHQACTRVGRCNFCDAVCTGGMIVPRHPSCSAKAPGCGRYPVIGYYAGARAIPLGGLGLDAALAEGRRQGARFLVVDSERLPSIRPDLLPLLAGTPGGRADLELVKVVEDRGGRRVLIYRIAGAA